MQRKMYFGWVRGINGVAACRATEEDGVPIGGKIDWLQKHELTVEKWNYPLWILEKEYPYVAPPENPDAV